METAAKAVAVLGLVVLVPAGLVTVVLEVLLRTAAEKVDLAEELLLQAVRRLRRRVEQAKVSQPEA